jgi:hypothetical protein
VAGDWFARPRTAPCPIPPRARIQGDKLLDLGGEHRLPWPLGRQPQMMAPGFQLVVHQHPLDRLRQDGRHAAVADQLPSQGGALPWRQGTSDHVRTLAGQLDHIPRHDRGQQPAAGRVVLCRTNRRGHTRQSAAPTCGHAVRVTRPVWRGRQTCVPQLIAGWPALVWRDQQGVSAVGAIPTKWRGCAHRSQSGALIGVPAWHPPGWCCAGVMTNQRPSVQFFNPSSMGTCTKHLRKKDSVVMLRSQKWPTR